jgi:hydroxymethylpyrimidine pyrophosphatase-like HAD family hydrolase
MKIEAPRTFLIDFDGTLCLHDFPFIGDELPKAIEVLKKLQDAGHDLILLTMRYGIHLDEAKEWCKLREIEFFSVNCNPMYETGSRKVYGHIHIDDHNLGIPLIHDHTIHRKPFVDWGIIDKMLEEKGYYIKQDVVKKSVQS